MRLDVSVNMLTFQALSNKKITVFGGGQTRPNIHILDMVRVYQHFLANPSLESGCYNAGFENISILEIAEKIRSKTPSEIYVSDSNDPRSYKQNSDKLISTGFTPKYSVDFAINELIEKYNDGLLKETESSYTIKRMKSISINL
jgi:nucleoside-diphosphate-sugar epimerase